VHLDVRAAVRDRGIERDARGNGDAEARVVMGVGDGHRGVVHGRPRRFGSRRRVGAEVLDRLIRADRTAELLTCEGVRDGRVECAACEPGADAGDEERGARRRGCARPRRVGDSPERHRRRRVEALHDLVHGKGARDRDAMVVPEEHDPGIGRPEARMVLAGARDRDRGACVGLGQQRERQLHRRESPPQRHRDLRFGRERRCVEASRREQRVDRPIEERVETRDRGVLDRSGEQVHQRGRPRRRSATMVRWISDVPPPIVAARLAR
jgi:hypothetical protein